jgi:hypothetical protein
MSLDDDLRRLIVERVAETLGPLPDPCVCVEPKLGEWDIKRRMIQCVACKNWLTEEYLRGLAGRLDHLLVH